MQLVQPQGLKATHLLMATSNYPVNQLVASLLPHETLQARRDQRIDLIGPHMRGVEAEVGREGAMGLHTKTFRLK